MIEQFLRTLIEKTRTCLLIISCLLVVNGCEKDDICVEGDTSLLIIRFYDSENPDQFKSVTNLRVIGLGQENPVDTFTDRSSQDSIAIPLRINEPDTGFLLILDSADEDMLETGNIDTLSFTYNTQEEFVSRACGFVANYTELQEVLTADSDNWIQNIEIISTTVKSQESAHVQIFH